jgi:ribosomal protein S27AE
MVMWRAKSCPRCSGDIFIDIDEDTWFDHCLQCGYIKPRLKEVCPQCGFGMFLDSDVGNKFYRCSHCGNTFELHKANK